MSAAPLEHRDLGRLPGRTCTHMRYRPIGRPCARGRAGGLSVSSSSSTALSPRSAVIGWPLLGPAPVPRPRPPRRRLRRAGVSVVAALSTSSTGRAAPASCRRSEACGGRARARPPRDRGSGPRTAARAARAAHRRRRLRPRHDSRPRNSNADGCDHRGCRGGASCERATLRRREAPSSERCISRPQGGRLSRRLRRRRHDGVARHRFGHRGVPFS